MHGNCSRKWGVYIWCVRVCFILREVYVCFQVYTGVCEYVCILVSACVFACVMFTK